MTEQRCQWLVDPVIGLWHLPGCWGAVIGGPDCCYCEPEEGTIDHRLMAIEGQLQLFAEILSSLKPKEANHE